jgi:hypothetical protein
MAILTMQAVRSNATLLPTDGEMQSRDRRPKMSTALAAR